MTHRKCHNCGATLKAGTNYCEYCGTDWTPPIEEMLSTPALDESLPTQPPAGQKPKTSHIVIFLILLFFCGPIALVYLWVAVPWNKKGKILVTVFFLVPVAFFGVFGLISEMVYTVRMDAPKVSSHPPALEQRPVEDIDIEEVFLDLRGGDGLLLSERKQKWKAEYEGRWVQWSGRVIAVNVYKHTTSMLDLKPTLESPVTLRVFFDPLNNDRLTKISIDDQAEASGRLWSYNFLSDTISLADGIIVSHEKEKNGRI